MSDIVESIERYISGADGGVPKAVRTRMVRARDEIVRMRAKLATLEPPQGKYNPAPVYTANCLRHPGAPHSVDVDASWRAGKTVCVCQNWTPGEAS